MDARLFLLGGRMLRRLRQQDLPEVSRAIVGAIRHRYTLTSAIIQDVAVIRIVSPKQEVTILKDDWAKIMPYIQDETLTPVLNPTNPQVGYLDPQVSYDEPLFDQADRPLYLYILGLLQRLFPDSIPVSNL